MNVRVGFIGAGGIAHRHFGVLEQFEDVEIAAVCDVDPTKAEQASASTGAAPFSDPMAMLDSMALDALFICVPPFAHGAPEHAAIARGLPFFVEKPVTLQLSVAEEIAQAVAQAGLITGVGYHWRYLEPLEEVCRILESRPARLISGYWLDQTPPPAWWHRLDRCGGQMVEQTTHVLDLARYLVGEPISVFGLAAWCDRPEFADLDVPAVSTASLKFESGAIGNIGSTCLLRWAHRVALHLFGDGFAIELTDHDVTIDQGKGRMHRQAIGDPVVRQDRDFIDAVKAGPNRIRCPYADAVRTHRVALAIAESARTGRPIDLACAEPELTVAEPADA